MIFGLSPSDETGYEFVRRMFLWSNFELSENGIRSLLRRFIRSLPSMFCPKLWANVIITINCITKPVNLYTYSCATHIIQGQNRPPVFLSNFCTNHPSYTFRFYFYKVFGYEELGPFLRFVGLWFCGLGVI